MGRDHHHLLRTAASRRAVLRALAAAASTAALGGCAALTATDARLDAAELSADPTLLVATTRKPVNGARAAPWFGPERASRMSVARAKLTPPDEGRFSYAAGLERLAPRRHRNGGAGRRSRPRRRRARRAHLRPRLQPDFEAAALDAARLERHPLPRRDHGVLLAVEGQAVRLRLRPRERHVVARCLEQVFAGLLASEAVGRIHVVAHSIGTMLTMEALRQIYARQGSAVVERIGAVVFAFRISTSTYSRHRSSASARSLRRSPSRRPTTGRSRCRAGSPSGSSGSARPSRPSSSAWACG